MDNIRDKLQGDSRRQAREQLEGLLVEGLNSGPISLMEPSHWAALRAKLRQQFGDVAFRSGTAASTGRE
jgi:hypothetical protein